MCRPGQIALLTLFALLATEVPTEAQTRVHGSLLGADGQPMPKAHVIIQDGPVDTTIVAAADERGRFSLTLPETGGYGLYLTGVHHKTLETPLIVTSREPVELNVQLGTYEYENAPDSVWVTMSSNGYEKKGATLMTTDGEAFSTTLSSDADTLAYQIIGVRKSRSPRATYTISGANVDRYTFNESGPFWDRRGDYVSVLETKKEVSTDVELRLDELPSPGQEPSFQSGNSTVEEIAGIYRETEAIVQRIGKKARAYRPLVKKASTDEERKALQDSVKQIMRQFTDSLTAPVRQRIKQENAPLLREWLMLRYFDELDPPDTDSMLARRVLREVSPTSPLWSYEAWSRVGASNLIGKLAWKANAPKLASSYMENVIENHPDADVRRHFLYRAIRMADNAGDEKRKMRHYGQMMSEFEETYHAKQIEREYAPNKNIQAGKPIPDYSLTAMTDSSVTYTDEKMKGSVYLINTWATWCRPCIAKMDELHKIYEKYRDEGFDILSISLDEKQADVEEFRREQWKMPWKHHFAGFSGEGRKTIEQTFEVVGIPHPILVDENGQIIAADDSLRGENLSQTLERVFEGG
jgi:thiol-disulfide isomerase/thioredoxin